MRKFRQKISCRPVSSSTPSSGDAYIGYDGKEFYIEVRGKRIARRGEPGTPQAKTWVSLEPGWRVFDDGDLNKLSIQYDRYEGGVVQ